MPTREIRRRLARAIIIDRATPNGDSLVERVARARSRENYRFAARFVAGKRVLDIGGGAGLGHDLLLEAGAASIVSLDPHVGGPPGALDPRVRFVRGDFLAHPLDDAAFDTIVCLGTLFYLADTDAALAKMHRLLAPGGTLVVNCINQRLVRRYFAMALEEIDGKFTAAYDEPGLRERIRHRFAAEPAFYVQQPVPMSRSLADRVGFWLAPLTWTWRRHPVMPKPPGTEGMFVCAVVSKAG